MKRQVAKAGFWLLTLTMGGTTEAAAQIAAYAQTFSSVRADAGSRDMASVFRSAKSSEGEAPLGAAAGSSLPDAPSAVAERQAPEESPTAMKAPLPSANRSMGSVFLVANGALLGSTIANVEMIARCRPSSCQAVPDAIRSRGALYGIGIPVTLGVSYISYRLKRNGTKLWILPVALFTAGNIVYAVHASHWSTSTH
jgi:hypothetical protein